MEEEIGEEVDWLEWANRIESGKEPVAYFCKACGHAHIERDKVEMNSRGRWRRTGQEGSTVGFHLNSMASQLFRWRDMLAKFFRSKDDPDKFRVFWNSNLALPWEEKGKRAELGAVLSARGKLVRGVIPVGTRALNVGIDVQTWGCPWVLRAYSPGLRVHIVDYGVATSLAEIETLVMNAGWECEMGGTMTPSIAFVDSNYDTDNVYRFCAFHPSARMAPIRGLQTVERSKDPFKESKGSFAGGEIDILLLDTSRYKDKEFSLFSSGRVEFPANVETEFARQYTSEECADELSKRTNFTKRIWRKRHGAQDNHYWDCGIYSLAAADIQGFFEWDNAQPQGQVVYKRTVSQGGSVATEYVANF
jgi:phage terminase large subunit GpA-like protein